MANFDITLTSSGADSNRKARALAAVYREILNWLNTDPQKETATTDLGGEMVADSTFTPTESE